MCRQYYGHVEGQRAAVVGDGERRRGGNLDGLLRDEDHVGVLHNVDLPVVDLDREHLEAVRLLLQEGRRADSEGLRVVSDRDVDDAVREREAGRLQLDLEVRVKPS